MALDMRGRCERCSRELDPAGPAWICAEACTFCTGCATELQHVCPNCGGELAARPRRGPAGAGASDRVGTGPSGIMVRFEIARGLLGSLDARQVAWRTVYSGLGSLGVRSGAMFVLESGARYRRLAAAGLRSLPAAETLSLPPGARDWMLSQSIFTLTGPGAARAIGEAHTRLVEHDAAIGAAVRGARGLQALLVFGPPLMPGEAEPPVDLDLFDALAGLAAQALEPFAGDAALARPARATETPRAPRASKQARSLAALREEFPALTGMIGESRALLEACNDLVAVAPTRFPVLLTGESGVGKELAARAVHEMSERAGSAMEIVDCGSIPGELIESELFGHVRGAFTGAQRDRRGAFEMANRGTLFLDEIGEMPLQLQTRLLRVLQEGRFRRVGDERLIDVDVRVIAATNRDLAAEVAARRFRQDLYYRLNVFAVHLPSLRERPGDIGALLQHFLMQQGRELSVKKWRADPDVVSALEQYEWPGNIRELVNLCTALVVHARSTGIVTPADLAHVWKRQYVGREAPWREGAPPQREHLGEWVLEQARGAKFNLVELARMLQRQKRAGQRVPIAERSALSYYLTGEILRALAEANGDPELATRALGREEDLMTRVRGRVAKVFTLLTETDSDLAAVRARFAKLPAGYEDTLERAWASSRS